MMVTLNGVESPFVASTLSDVDGHFRFRALAPGSYTIDAFAPGLGEIRRTVVVTASMADSKGVVVVEIPRPSFDPAVAKSESTVSKRQLAVPERARRKYDEAQKELSRRNASAASTCLREAVSIAPDYEAAWNTLGVIAYQTRDYPQAEHYFREALRAEPGAWEPTVNLGGVLLNLDRPQEALLFNGYAVLGRPQDALANSQLGLDYFLLDDLDHAERFLTAAEHIDPSHFSQPELTLAKLYLKRGDNKSALRELHEFVARFPDAPAAAGARLEIQKLQEP